MQRSVSELLVYGLIIAGVLLFNYLMQQFTKRVREQEEAAARETPSAPAEAEMPEYIWGRRPAAAPTPAPEPEARLAPARRTQAPAAAPPSVRAPATARQLFRTRQDLRRAIVVLTVLGPCRALDPPENREAAISGR